MARHCEQVLQDHADQVGMVEGFENVGDIDKDSDGGAGVSVGGLEQGRV